MNDGTAPLSSGNKALLAAGAILVSGAFGISMFFEGYRDIHYAPAILCMIVFACGCILPAVRSGLEIPRAPAAMALAALWVYITVSLAWSSVPYASLVTYLVFTALPLAFFAPLMAPQRAALTQWLFYALMAAIAVAALWAVIQYFFFAETYGPRAHHPLPSPNNLAAVINLGLLPALAFFYNAKDRKMIFWGALASLLFAALVATQSRGGIICACLMGGVVVRVLRPPQIKILGVAGMASLLFIAISAFHHLDFVNRLAALATPAADAPALARVAIWENTWRMVQDHFWLGTGFGTFYLYYPSYRLPGADNSTGNWAHMDPLQYWAELGIAAPVLLYALCGAVLWRTFKALKALPAGEPDRAMIAGLACGLAAVMLHTHVDFNLYIMPILIGCGVWLALWYRITAQAVEGSYAPVILDPWQKPFMGVVTLAIAGLLCVMAVSSAAGQYYLVKAKTLIAQGLPDQFTAAIADAERWAPRSFIDPEVNLAALYIDLLGPGSAGLFSPEEQQSLYVQTLELLEAAQGENPPWAEIDYKRGQLYSEVDHGFAPDAQAKAVESFEAAVRKNPMHVSARQMLAALYVKQGKVDLADQLLDEGLKYPHSAATEEAFQKIRDHIAPLVAIKRSYDARQSGMPDVESVP